MRDIIADVVRQTSGLFDVVTVEATDTETCFLAYDGGRTLFMNAYLKEPSEELVGQYGLSNLGFLNGLLSSPTYKSDDATLRSKRKGNAIEMIEFRDSTGKSTASYRTMAYSLCPPVQRVSADIAYDVVVEPQKAKLAEFSYMANLFKEIDGHFTVSVTKEGDLAFAMGGGSAVTHSANLIFAEGVHGKLPNPLPFSTAHFLAVMKLADKQSAPMRVNGRGVLNVDIETPLALYRFFLKAKLS